jgi:hypothetical protein|tara:strand:- start:375 stop:626 length:252 start_codon:yes stop_codon:yes gene_type:complete
MKITPEIIAELECVLDMRKKNGEPIWEDGTEIEFGIAGTFAADKFITIKKKTTRVDSNPDPDLKPHHEISYDPKYLIPIDKRK